MWPTHKNGDDMWHGHRAGTEGTKPGLIPDVGFCP